MSDERGLCRVLTVQRKALWIKALNVYKWASAILFLKSKAGVLLPVSFSSRCLAKQQLQECA